MDESEVVSLDNEWTRTKFLTTPLMSTYILAFIVSDFTPVETVGPNDLKIRVWCRDEYRSYTEYALETIPKAFQFFQDYFNISEVVTKSGKKNYNVNLNMFKRTKLKKISEYILNE